MSKTIRVHFIAIIAVFAGMLLSVVLVEAAEFKKIIVPKHYGYEEMAETAEKASSLGGVAVMVHSESPELRQAAHNGFKGFAIAIIKADPDKERSNNYKFAIIYGNDTDSHEEITKMEYFVSGVSSHEFFAVNVSDYEDLEKKVFDEAKTAVSNYRKALEEIKGTGQKK